MSTLNLEQRAYALLARKTRYSYGATLAEHQMRAYRLAILSIKAKFNLVMISNGKPRARRIARGVMYYKGWVQAYLAAKREFLCSPTTDRGTNNG